MKVKIWTLAFDTDIPDPSGTGCEVYTTEAALNARLAVIMRNTLNEEDSVQSNASWKIKQLLNQSEPCKIREAWEIWEDSDNGLRDHMDTYSVDEHELDLFPAGQTNAKGEVVLDPMAALKAMHEAYGKLHDQVSELIECPRVHQSLVEAESDLLAAKIAKQLASPCIQANHNAEITLAHYGEDK